MFFSAQFVVACWYYRCTTLPLAPPPDEEILFPSGKIPRSKLLPRGRSCYSVLPLSPSLTRFVTWTSMQILVSRKIVYIYLLNIIKSNIRNRNLGKEYRKMRKIEIICWRKWNNNNYKRMRIVLNTYLIFSKAKHLFWGKSLYPL